MRPAKGAPNPKRGLPSPPPSPPRRGPYSPKEPARCAACGRVIGNKPEECPPGALHLFE